jgi:phosphoribosyl 1,2-cyclic phosphodiesterase
MRTSRPIQVQFVGTGDAFGSGGRLVLIAEAYFYDKPVKFHLSLKALEANLSRIRPRRLILTHMSDDMLSRLGGLPFETACDGLVVAL